MNERRSSRFVLSIGREKRAFRVNQKYTHMSCLQTTSRHVNATKSYLYFGRFTEDAISIHFLKLFLDVVFLLQK